MGRFVKKDYRIEFPSPLEMGSAKPLDARFVVETKADLTNIDTWAHSDTAGTGLTNVYQGMDVYVLDEKAAYRFVGTAYTVSEVTDMASGEPKNWKKSFPFAETSLENCVTEIEGKNGISTSSTTTSDGTKKYTVSLDGGFISGIDSAVYSSDTESLYLTFTNASGGTLPPVQVPMKDLIEEYYFTSAATADYNVAFTSDRNVSGKTTVKADVTEVDCGDLDTNDFVEQTDYTFRTR